MKLTILLGYILVHVASVSAAEISTNFWDKLSDRITTLHGYAVEIDQTCAKEGVNHLGINNHAAIAMGDILGAHLRLKPTTPRTPLSEIKKCTSAQILLCGISEQCNGRVSKILAFSKLSNEQKQVLVEKLEKLNKLMTRLIADLDEQILNVAELGL